MIQSVKFDSLNMGIKTIANSLFIFTVKRTIEITGLIISAIGLVFLVALISYSPNDPNFIFPENIPIENLMGFRGSYTSDLFLQSLGLISYLIPFSLIFSGINILKRKNLLLILENLFFVLVYCLLGSLFFDFFYKNAFTLYINGNGGFVGEYLNQSPLFHQ